MNPYGPPSSPEAPPYGYGYGPPPAAPPPAAGAGVTEASAELLRQTRPWVIVVAVVLAILSGFMLLGGLAVVGIGMLMPKVPGMGGIGAAEALLMGAIYIPLAALYVYPTIKLWQYAAAIGRLLASHSSVDLEAALLRQKSFWKFSAITMLALIGVYVLVFVGAIGMGIVAGMGR